MIELHKHLSHQIPTNDAVSSTATYHGYTPNQFAGPWDQHPWPLVRISNLITHQIFVKYRYTNSFNRQGLHILSPSFMFLFTKEIWGQKFKKLCWIDHRSHLGSHGFWVRNLGMVEVSPLLRVSENCNQGVSWDCGLLWCLRSPLKLLWLLAEFHSWQVQDRGSQFLKAAAIPYCVSPSLQYDSLLLWG